jgi:hypothetical protein
VTKIETKAFQNCSSHLTVSQADSIIDTAHDAFLGCEAVTIKRRKVAQTGPKKGPLRKKRRRR